MNNRNHTINDARPHPIRLIGGSIIALLALALGAGSAMATTGTWINSGAGDLTAAGSWSGGTPNGVGDVANITNTAMTSGNKTFNVNANITYGVLNLNTNRTSNFNSTNSGVLVFDNTGSTAAQLNTNNLGNGDQNYVINAAIQLNDSLNITNSAVAGNKSLTLGAISSTNGALTITNTSANHATTSSTRLNGIISDGSGSISLVNSAGFMELTAANTFSGTATNTSGIIRLTNALALQNSVLNTTGSVTGNGVAAGNGFKILTTSTLTIGGLSGSKNLSSLFNTLVDASNNGYVSLTALTLNPLSGSVNYSGVIANGAANMTLTKTGAGTQILSSATGNTYTGATSINAGTLLVQNTSNSATGSGAVTVAAGATHGTLGGTGIISASSILVTGDATPANNAVLMIGNTDNVGGVASTLKGNLNLASSGTTTIGGMVQFDIFSRTSATNTFASDNNDLLNLSGLGTVDFGSTAIIKVNDVFFGGLASGTGVNLLAVGDSWRLVDWGSAAHGTELATFDLPTISGFDWDTSQFYTAGTISLTAVPEPGRAVLMLLGAAGLLMRRRRRE